MSTEFESGVVYFDLTALNPGLSLTSPLQKEALNFVSFHQALSHNKSIIRKNVWKEIYQPHLLSMG